MKNSKLIIRKEWCLVTVFMFFCIQQSVGQTYTQDENTEAQAQQMTNANTLFSLLGSNTQPNTRNSAIQGNSVFVRQIGSLNEAKIRTGTQTSEINLLQNGDYNSTDLFYNTKSAYTDLVQNGSYNTIEDYVNDPQADVSLELIQDGDYKTFKREGINSLTRSLKFKQETPTIIVRSFN